MVSSSWYMCVGIREHTLTQSAGEVAKVAIIAALAPFISTLSQDNLECAGRDSPHPEMSNELGTPHSGRTSLAIYQFVLVYIVVQLQLQLQLA